MQNWRFTLAFTAISFCFIGGVLGQFPAPPTPPPATSPPAAPTPAPTLVHTPTPALPTVSLPETPATAFFTVEQYPAQPTQGEAALVWAKAGKGAQAVLKVQGGTAPPAEVPMIPIGTTEWHMAAIPGFHSGTEVKYRVATRLPQAGETKTFSYTVGTATLRDVTPPLILYLEPLTLVLPPNPQGFALGEGKEYPLKFLVVDNAGIKDAKLRYDAGSGWVDMVPRENALFAQTKAAMAKIPGATGTALPISLLDASVPAQRAGTLVKFTVRSEDTNGNSIDTPIAAYFAVKDKSPTKVMVVDPHFQNWVYKESAENYRAIAAKYARNYVPSDIIGDVNKVADFASKIASVFIPRHYWEAVAAGYNMSIVQPDGLSEALKASPNVVILSNLWLSPWDLTQTKGEKSAMETLREHLRKTHAGLIMTHGTLADWQACSSKDKCTSVGARGHAGEQLNQVFKPDGKTLAGLAGLDIITFIEWLKVQIAQALQQNDKTLPVGLALNSTPLQVPYVPFPGKMLVRSPGGVAEGLPESFTFTIPNFKQNFRFDAYTQVGWQLGMPLASAERAMVKAKEAADNAKPIFDDILRQQEAYSGQKITSEPLVSSLKSEMERVLDVVKTMELDGKAEVTIILPDGQKQTISIQEAKQAAEQLLALLPIQVPIVSDEGLAGVVTWDEYFYPQGYRGVYFSIEPEASSQNEASKMLTNAIEWTQRWRFITPLEFLGKLPLPSALKGDYQTITQQAKGETDKSQVTLGGGSSLLKKINLEGDKSIAITILSPASRVEVTSRATGVTLGETKAVKIRDGLWFVLIESKGRGAVELSITPKEPLSSMVPLHVEVTKAAPESVSLPTPKPEGGTLGSGPGPEVASEFSSASGPIPTPTTSLFMAVAGVAWEFVTTPLILVSIAILIADAALKRRERSRRL